MANEIQAQVSLTATKGNFKQPKLGGSQQNITMSGQGGGLPGQVIADNTGVDVTLTGIVAVGWCYIKNTDTINNVEIGPKQGGTFYAFMLLKPGEEVTFRLHGAVPGTRTLHVKTPVAATTVKLQLVVLED